MPSTSTLEEFSGLHEPPPFFDPEEDTLVPPLAMGYTDPPLHLVLVETQPTDSDEALLEAAVGSYRRQVAMIALAVGGLTLGVAMALIL